MSDTTLLSQSLLIVRKDARRFAIVLLMTVIAGIASTFIASNRPDETSNINEIILQNLFNGVLIFTFLPFLIWSDHPTDENTYLRTRPLDPGALVLGKLFLLFIVGAIYPALLRACRDYMVVGPDYILLTLLTLERIIGYSAVLIVALALCAHTKKIDRYITYVLVYFFFVGFSISILNFVKLIVASIYLSTIGVLIQPENYLQQMLNLTGSEKISGAEFAAEYGSQELGMLLGVSIFCTFGVFHLIKCYRKPRSFILAVPLLSIFIAIFAIGMPFSLSSFSVHSHDNSILPEKAALVRPAIELVESGGRVKSYHQLQGDFIVEGNYIVRLKKLDQLFINNRKVDSQYGDYSRSSNSFPKCLTSKELLKVSESPDATVLESDEYECYRDKNVILLDSSFEPAEVKKTPLHVSGEGAFDIFSVEPEWTIQDEEKKKRSHNTFLTLENGLNERSFDPYFQTNRKLPVNTQSTYDTESPAPLTQPLSSDILVVVQESVEPSHTISQLFSQEQNEFVSLLWNRRLSQNHYWRVSRKRASDTTQANTEPRKSSYRGFRLSFLGTKKLSFNSEINGR